ncbi:MAG: translocation/assembly module TamB domain-containing protein, partial [Bacteroidales bacterium]|nr:translocation/assembly module TamB domain-containing protein [Bacteroidales bacterium]
AWDTQLNIDATYKTKASLSTIIADSTAINTRRAVDCGIRVTDKLKDPKIAFSINVPDLEPSYKTRVESALSTEDKVQRQFLALLLSSTFLPDEQSGIANNTAVLFSNVSELMTTQLNNIFMKLNIPLDLGFNYQMTSTGANLFDVAVSTQLFNNRVLVNGVIGNKQQNGGSNNEVVGDIDIEVKINPSGSLRASAFSHSSDQYTNYLDNLQRTGIGISWQQEFNSFVSYIKQIFSNKKDRGVMEQQEKEINENAGTKRVIIQ